MNKAADLSQILTSLQGRAGDAGSAIKGWYENLNPEVTRTMLRGLAGAAIGGATTGGIAALTPRDREDRRGVLGPALTGAILGGTGAAALPLGLKLIAGGVKFKGEPARPAGARTLENAVDPLLSNPLTTTGAVAGGALSMDSLRALAHAMTHTATNPGHPLSGAVSNTGAPVLQRLREALRGPHAEQFWSQNRNWKLAPVADDAKHFIRYSRGKLALLPLAVLAGMAGDRYLKGRW